MPEAIGVLGRIAHRGDTQVISVLRAELGYQHVTVEVKLAVLKCLAVLLEPSDQEGINQISSAMASGDTSHVVRVAAAVALAQVTRDSDAWIELLNTLVDRLSPMSTGVFEKPEAAIALVRIS